MYYPTIVGSASDTTIDPIGLDLITRNVLTLTHTHYAGCRVGQLAVFVTFKILNDRVVGPVRSLQPKGPVDCSLSGQ